MARLMPFPAIEGTVCAALPASYSRLYRIGSLTRLRNYRCPCGNRACLHHRPRAPPRAWICSQIRSSDQSSGMVAGSTWKYSRGAPVDTRASPGRTTRPHPLVQQVRQLPNWVRLKPGSFKDKLLGETCNG